MSWILKSASWYHSEGPKAVITLLPLGIWGSPWLSVCYQGKEHLHGFICLGVEALPGSIELDLPPIRDQPLLKAPARSLSHQDTRGSRFPARRVEITSPEVVNMLDGIPGCRVVDGLP